MPIEIVDTSYKAPGTGWTGFNTPHSSNVGQTHGPAGMGIGAYMNRPETQPGFKPFTIPRPGYDSSVGTSMQTDGPAGMGMRPYINRPETQPGFKPFMPPSEFNRMRDVGITNPNIMKYPVINATSYMDPTADDYFLREFGQYMKRFLPGYDAEQDEFRQKQFRDSLEEENTTPDFIYQEDETGLPLPIMEAGMDDSFQYLQRQIDELNPDSPNYEDQLELLQSDMDMKYPWMQMAELTDDQINFMGSPLNTPDFGGMTKEELYNKVKEMEDTGIFGFGAQEPTTIEEFNEMYERMKRGEIGNWVT